MLDFEGPWLVRVFTKPVAALVADGVKKIENVMLRDWLQFGNSGVIVTGVIQGAARLGSSSQLNMWTTSRSQPMMGRLLP